MRSKRIYHLVLPIAIVLFLNVRTWAQDTTDIQQKSEVRSLNKVKLYLVGFGLEREQKVSKLSTISFRASIESVVPFFPMQPQNSSDILRFSYSINAAPVLSAAYKYYYNLNRRVRLGKSIQNNRASFAGFEYDLIMPILYNNLYTSNTLSSFSPFWGYHESLSKHFNIELDAGPSFQTDFKRMRISALFRLGVNFML